MKAMLLSYAEPRSHSNGSRHDNAAFQFLRLSGLVVKHVAADPRKRHRTRKFVVSDMALEFISKLPDDFGLDYLYSKYPDFRDKYDKQTQSFQAAWDSGKFGPTCGCWLKHILERINGEAALRDPHGVTVEVGAPDEETWLTICRSEERQHHLLAVRYRWRDGAPEISSAHAASRRQREFYQAWMAARAYLRRMNRIGLKCRPNPQRREWLANAARQPDRSLSRQR